MRAKRVAVGSLLVALLLVVCPIASIADPPPEATQYAPREMSDLEQLVGPIALYPDALLAQVLAATTYPNDVIAAAQWEDAGNNPAAIDAQPWDDSVKGLARFPAVLHYLAANVDWMNDLGSSFLNQQADVMSAVQLLRGEALAAGTLASTPQMQVVNEGGYIQIIPANPDVMYVPVYNPQAVYTQPPYEGGDVYSPFITFGVGVDIGDWLDFDLDWYARGIYFGRWGRNRPWWHLHDGGANLYYTSVRPGLYAPGRFQDSAGHPIDAAASRWAHDVQRPGPREIHRPAPVIARPERGYAAEAVENRPAALPHGTDVNRQSERGRESLQRAAPQPTRAPEPREAPQPQRREPEPAAPRPEARPSAPVNGGAMGGYQRGEEAERSASRGAASRGGGGGGGGGGRRR